MLEKGQYKSLYLCVSYKLKIYDVWIEFQLDIHLIEENINYIEYKFLYISQKVRDSRTVEF